MARFQFAIGMGFLLCVLFAGAAQLRAADQAGAGQSVVEKAAAIVQNAKTLDQELIAALEKHIFEPTLTEAAAGDVLAALSATTTDTDTILKLFSLFSVDPEQAPFATAAIQAAARQAAVEVKTPEQAVPVLTAIEKVQPAMNKFAWRGGAALRPYADLLAVFIDHCPPDNAALSRRLADIEIRHITAARFTLPPEEAQQRLNRIDPAKLTRDKDRDQLDFLQMDIAHRANRLDDAGKFAKAIWGRPKSQFRDDAWPILFASLRAAGQRAEASALLDEVAKDPAHAAEVPEYRKQLEIMATTQPTNP